MSQEDAIGRQVRQQFYLRLLALPLTDPATVFRELAAAWLEAADARSVTLWLYNTFRGQFQLNAVAGEVGRIDGLIKPVLRPLNMGEFVAKTGLPVLTANIGKWQGTCEGQEYRAALAREFTEDFGCPGECCIPLLLPDPSGAPDKIGPYMGIVSLHYAGFADGVPPLLRGLTPGDATQAENRPAVWIEESLVLMGRLTASVLTNLRREEQLKTARRLAQLAETHLTRYTDDPKSVRRDYLDAVIELLKERLQVSSVSIFCRVPQEDRIVCVASTGLKRLADGRTLLKSELMDAGYTQEGDGDRRTWRAFESGAEEFLETEGRQGKFVELTSRGEPVRGMMLIYPIKQTPVAAASPPPEAGDSRVLGVIRCGHEVKQRHGCDLLTFDIVELETLRFIVDQISPVLHTLESRIQREEMIQVVKHDLLAPLQAIRDAVDHVHEAVAHGRRADEYYIENLRESALRLGGLTELLARDPSGRRKPYPNKTNLESQIVAPMKRMLTPFASETSQMDLRFEGVNQIPPLNIDRSLIERALYNLIVNAVKYGQRGSTVRIEGRILPGGFGLDVENEGRGVEPQYVDRLFTPYFRSPLARSTRQGEGLGLAVVKGIMKSHGGDVLLARAADPTVFRLFFPDKLRA